MPPPNEADAPGPGPDAPRDVSSLYARHAHFVWANLSRLGVRDADLEDMLQEVFVVVHRRLDTYDPQVQVTTWLFGICLRVASTYRRHARRHPEDPTEATTMEARASSGGDPEEAASAGQLHALLERYLDELDLEKRAVFVMFEGEGLSCADIAATLGVPVGTVYSRLHAARHGLARALETASSRAKRSR